MNGGECKSIAPFVQNSSSVRFSIKDTFVYLNCNDLLVSFNVGKREGIRKKSFFHPIRPIRNKTHRHSLKSHMKFLI